MTVGETWTGAPGDTPACLRDSMLDHAYRRAEVAETDGRLREAGGLMMLANMLEAARPDADPPAWRDDPGSPMFFGWMSL